MRVHPKVVEALATRDQSVDAVLPECSLPDPLPSNVQGLAAQILSTEELEITECDTVALVGKLQSKEWLCEPVVKAFLKRAALAQKTVSYSSNLQPSFIEYSRLSTIDQLHHRAPLGLGHRPGSRSGLAAAAGWSASRASSLHQGAVRRSWKDEQQLLRRLL